MLKVVCTHILVPVLLVLLPTMALAQDGPVAVSEINRMLQADQTPDEIVAVIRERGAGFRLTSSVQRRLKEWGFEDEHLDVIKRIAAGEEVPDEQMPGYQAPPGEGGEDAENVEEEDYSVVGYPNSSGWHAANKRRIERAIDNAALGYERHELSRVTLYCNNARARTLVPLMRRLEEAVIARFPESLRNACDPRSAHLVVVDGESDWQRWVQALFNSYEADGLRFPPEGGRDVRERAAASGGMYMRTIGFFHADKAASDEVISREVTYGLGHLMIGQAADEERPDGLQTGFGNLTETMAMGTPGVMVQSYDDRDAEHATSWASVVQQLFRERKIDSTFEVWNFDTSTMVLPEYAQAWSYVSMLCQEPEKFAQAVRAIRQGTGAAEAIHEAYGLDDGQLLRAWARFLN